MIVELLASLERELRNLAVVQSRNIGEILEEAVRQYLEAAAITDLDLTQIGEAQMVLARELRGLE